jgi:hypothetical protein
MSRDDGWERYMETCHAERGTRMVEVTFELPRECLPLRTESLWAEQVGPDLFVLRNSPLCVSGVNFLDTIRAERRGAEWFFVEVHARAGRSTFRVRRAGRSLREPWARTLAPVKRLGCSFEGVDERWATVDVPATADVHAVLAALRHGEEQRRWRFEEAHFGCPKA